VVFIGGYMPRKELYAKMTEEQKDVERLRAKIWHRKNYDKIKERKQANALRYWKEVGKAKYDAGTSNVRFKLSRLINAAKSRSKTKDIPFNIDLEYMFNMYNEQGGKCCLSGREFYLGEATNKTASENSMSIDRIIPSKGYTQGNVRLVVHHVNMAMSVFGLEAFLELAKDVKKHHEK
jgi:hypothetical protein